MNKMLVVIGIIIAILGIGFALDEGFIQNPLGGVTPTAIQKDMLFPTEISTALANEEIAGDARAYLSITKVS
jgi:hypothetical protein